MDRPHTISESTRHTSYQNLVPYREGEVPTDWRVGKDHHVNSTLGLQPDLAGCGWQWLIGSWAATSKVSVCNYINCCFRRTPRSKPSQLPAPTMEPPAFTPIDLQQQPHRNGCILTAASRPSPANFSSWTSLRSHCGHPKPLTEVEISDPEQPSTLAWDQLFCSPAERWSSAVNLQHWGAAPQINQNSMKDSFPRNYVSLFALPTT